MVEQSDPVVLRNLDQKSRHRNKVKSLPIPPEVIALCREPENVDPLAALDLVVEGYDDVEPPALITEFEDHNVIEFNLEFSDPE